MLVAAEHHLLDKLGSLATLHGRVLARVGFSQEADDSFERGLALVQAHGTDVQHFYASLNQAWTAFDRGWMNQAEQGYAAALSNAEQIESAVSAADKQIALARARFGSGDAARAVEGLARARAVAATTDAPVLEFIATIAEVEGALLYDRLSEARESVTRLRAIVETSFPAWMNRLATLQARVELQAGDRQAARRAVNEGLEATPYGANGARLRAELEAIGLAASDDWKSQGAAELNDRIIQAGWMGLAAWFMTVRAERDGDPDVAMIAAGLSHRLGNPMQAARAVSVAERWDDPRSDAVANAVERVARNLPDEWRSGFTALPFVAPALYRAGQIGDADEGALIAGLDEALAAAGLSGLEVLSPAQRRAAGLVAAPTKVRTALRWLAPLIGAAAVAAIVVALLIPEPAVVDDTATGTTTTVVTTTTLPPIEERVVPGEDLFGQAPYAGGDHRNAVYDYELGEPIGYYWRQPVTGFVANDPVMQGKALYVGTSQGFLSAFDVDNSGSVIFEDRQRESISASVEVGQVSFGQDGQGQTFVFYGDDSGVFRARNVDDASGQAWPAALGSPVTGPPLVRTEYVVVATEDGVLYKLRGSDGSELARYPAEGVVDGGFAEPIAAADGTIYAVTGSGVVKLIDEEAMSEICEVASSAGAAVTNVMIADDKWLFGSATTALFAYNAGTCGSSAIPAYQIDVPINDTPPITEGVIWAPADGLILSLNVDDGQGAFVPTNLEGTITSPPIVAGRYLLVGVSRAGQNELVAVSTENGEVKWRFRLPQPLRTRPVVGDGLIIVATDLELIAIAAPPG
jgi:outer membrane protein assembly factor BamB